MTTQTSLFAIARRAIAAGALAALLTGVAAPALPASAAGCGVCDDDGDGLTNEQEYGVYGTDLARSDTDGDNVDDGLEVYYGSDPLVADYAPTSGGAQNDPNFDYDGDGLGAYDEQTYGTDVTLADTDGDGLNDGDEVFSYGTAPLNADTDGDGYADGFELTRSMDPLVFNPFGP